MRHNHYSFRNVLAKIGEIQVNFVDKSWQRMVHAPPPIMRYISQSRSRVSIQSLLRVLTCMFERGIAWKRMNEGQERIFHLEESGC